MPSSFDRYDLPNPVEHAAQVLTRVGSYNDPNPTQQISLRLQFENFTKAQAMAEMSGLPRSEILNRVLDAGFYAIRSELTEDEQKTFQEFLGKAIKEAMSESKKDQKK